MRTVCVTLSRAYAREQAGGTVRDPETAKRYFESEGLKVDFFYGINAPQLGVVTTLPYEVDNPGSGFNIGSRGVGCWLSHRSLWAALLLLPEDYFLVLEDDAKFEVGWREKLDAALRDAPPDWDIIYVGACCAADKPRTQIRGDLYELKYPMCTHGYFVRKKALRYLIETQDAARLYAPIDISLIFHSLPQMKVFTVFPTIMTQHGTVLSP